MRLSKLLANPSGFAAALIAAAILAGPAPGRSLAARQAVNAQAAALKGFSDRVHHYLDLQQAADHRLPPLSPSNDPAAIERHQQALAAAIAAERREAKPGDIFGDAADLFRRVIRQDARTRAPRDAAAAMEEVPPRNPLKVNAPYPKTEPLATVPPLILTRLQRLPDGLEYRFMGRDLILHDVKANLIVDFIANAVPANPR
jgi:hypothetical protein